MLDWRTTWFFSGKRHRGTGVGAVVLKGAAEQARALGDGRVGGDPEDIEGRKVRPACPFDGALHMFGRMSLERQRRIGERR